MEDITCGHALFIVLKEGDSPDIKSDFHDVEGVVVTEVEGDHFAVCFKDRQQGLGLAVALKDTGIDYVMLQEEWLLSMPTLDEPEVTRLVTNHLKSCREAAATA